MEGKTPKLAQTPSSLALLEESGVERLCLSRGIGSVPLLHLAETVSLSELRMVGTGCQ